MRATSFFNFFIFLLFSLFFIASALPEAPNEFGLSARDVDQLNNVPTPDEVSNLATSDDVVNPEAGHGGGGGGGGYGCPRGYTQCSKYKKVCCPYGGTIASRTGGTRSSAAGADIAATSTEVTSKSTPSLGTADAWTSCYWFIVLTLLK